MAIGVAISLFSTAFILYQIFQIERNKAEILSLYVLLSLKEIFKVYSKCQQYMDNLNEARPVSTRKEEIKQQEDEESN